MDIKIKDINEVIQKLDEILGLPEFAETGNELTYEMNHALAQMFANKGFRNYLEMALNKQIKSLLRTETVNDIFFLKGRILTLKELLIISKRAFEKITESEKKK